MNPAGFDAGAAREVSHLCSEAQAEVMLRSIREGRGDWHPCKSAGIDSRGMHDDRVRDATGGAGAFQHSGEGKV